MTALSATVDYIRRRLKACQREMDRRGPRSFVIQARDSPFRASSSPHTHAQGYVLAMLAASRLASILAHVCAFPRGVSWRAKLPDRLAMRPVALDFARMDC